MRMITHKMVTPPGWLPVALPVTTKGRREALARMGLFEGQPVSVGEFLDQLLEGQQLPYPAKLENTPPAEKDLGGQPPPESTAPVTGTPIGGENAF